MKLEKIKLKWKLFLYILIFAFLVVFVFCFFQIFMLERFYKSTKTEQVGKLTDEAFLIVEKKDIFAENYDDSLSDELQTISSEGETAIYLFSISGNLVYKSSNGIYFNEFADIDVFNDIINKANATRLNKFFISFESSVPSSVGSFPAITESAISSADKAVICGRFITLNDNNNYLLVLDSRLTPVSPAIMTLKQQLLYISLIVIVLTIIVALVISKSISTPLMKMNKNAKMLASGRRDIIFDSKGFKEITELNETLNYAVSELNKTDNLQRELLANISHDLKTPLTLISGYAQMMMDIPDEFSSENLQVIVDETNRLNILVNDLLNLSRLQAKTESFVMKKFDITELIINVVDRQNKLNEVKGFKITFSYNDHVFVYADEQKISQVLYNFINNAINYSTNNKLVEVVQAIDNKMVKVSIIDHGIGIKKEDLDFIWNRYYRVDKCHQRSAQGSGLGLSIIKEILEYHGFKYGVVSDVNVGSTFWFEFERIE